MRDIPEDPLGSEDDIMDKEKADVIVDATRRTAMSPQPNRTTRRAMVQLECVTIRE
jgi:hypothetical protein